MDARQNVIALLEKALEAAREGRPLPEVGQVATQAAEAAGVPPNLLQLARETRAKGFGIEADLLGLAIDVATSADGQGEVYEHSLISIHYLACDRLDEVHDAKHHKPKEPPKEVSKTVSRLN